MPHAVSPFCARALKPVQFLNTAGNQCSGLTGGIRLYCLKLSLQAVLSSVGSDLCKLYRANDKSWVSRRPTAASFWRSRSSSDQSCPSNLLITPGCEARFTWIRIPSTADRSLALSEITGSSAFNWLLLEKGEQFPFSLRKWDHSPHTALLPYAGRRLDQGHHCPPGAKKIFSWVKFICSAAKWIQLKVLLPSFLPWVSHRTPWDAWQGRHLINFIGLQYGRQRWIGHVFTTPFPVT